jgi:hypothetical protein
MVADFLLATEVVAELPQAFYKSVFPWKIG